MSFILNDDPFVNGLNIELLTNLLPFFSFGLYNDWSIWFNIYSMMNSIFGTIIT
jgi:hypothetical protein